MTPNNITIKELKFALEIDESIDFENVAINISELTNKNLIVNLIRFTQLLLELLVKP